MSQTTLTYKQAIENGWKILDEKLQRKYVSRKLNLDDQPILQVTGNAHRSGEYYVEVPSQSNGYYSTRRYLNPPTASN